MLLLLFCGIGLIGCKTKPYHPMMGEDIIPTTGKQTITTPEENGAWYSDRYIKELFNECTG